MFSDLKLSPFHKVILVDNQQELGAHRRCSRLSHPVTPQTLSPIPPPFSQGAFITVVLSPAALNRLKPLSVAPLSSPQLVSNILLLSLRPLLPACPMGRTEKSPGVLPCCRLRLSSRVFGIWVRVPARRWGHHWLPCKEDR